MWVCPLGAAAGSGRALWVVKSLGGSSRPSEAWMIYPKMADEKGCASWRMQDKRTTVTVGTMMTIRITKVGLVTTIGYHCFSTMTTCHTRCRLPLGKRDRQTYMQACTGP
jgi:hypothetical protein